MLLGTNNMTMKKKVGMELSEKLNVSSDIYHRFGTSNPERMDNPSWLHLTRHPERGPEVLRTKSHIYHNDNGKYGALWTFCRKGMSKTETHLGTVYIGGDQDETSLDDVQQYNDIILTGQSGRTLIFGYPLDVFPTIHNHSVVYCEDENKLFIVGGMNKENRLHIYQLDLDTFQITKLADPKKKVKTLLNPQLTIDGDKLRISGGTTVSGSINKKKKYVFDIINSRWSK